MIARWKQHLGFAAAKSVLAAARSSFGLRSVSGANPPGTAGAPANPCSMRRAPGISVVAYVSMLYPVGPSLSSFRLNSP